MVLQCACRRRCSDQQTSSPASHSRNAGQEPGTCTPAMPATRPCRSSMPSKWSSGANSGAWMGDGGPISRHWWHGVSETEVRPAWRRRRSVTSRGDRAALHPSHCRRCLMGLVTAFSPLANLVFSWVPLYAEMKLIFVIFLWYPGRCRGQGFGTAGLPACGDRRGKQSPVHSEGVGRWPPRLAWPQTSTPPASLRPPTPAPDPRPSQGARGPTTCGGCMWSPSWRGMSSPSAMR